MVDVCCVVVRVVAPGGVKTWTRECETLRLIVVERIGRIVVTKQTLHFSVLNEHLMGSMPGIPHKIIIH